MKCWELTIEVLEDLHIGTGSGWGDIDSLQVRDRRGWPVLPASHIKGVLRQTAIDWHRVDPEAVSQQHIDRLFGRAGRGQGQLQLSSAYLDTERTTVVWGSTRIDPSTSTAQEKSLRFIEFIPAGACFEMQARLHEGKVGDDELLRAILARCRQLGGGRNRGQGLVRWQLIAPEKAHELSLVPPESVPARLRLILRNVEPVCLAHTGHPGNLIGTEPFIRGRTLRGALTSACLALSRPDWAQSFLAPMLSWGDALPLPECAVTEGLTELEVLPIPLSVGTPKATAPQGRLPWWALVKNAPFFGARNEIDLTTLKDGKHPHEKLKRPGNAEYLFRSASRSPWQRYQPQILQRLHTRVANQESGLEQALFSTEEIAEHTQFLADILVTDRGLAETLSQALSALSTGWLRCGRGGRPMVIEDALWLTMPVTPQPNAGSFTLLLESDLIVRDELGNFQDRLDASTLARLVNLDGDKVDCDISFSEGVDIFGFNAATGLPRQAQRAIKAGSVVRICGPDAMPLRQALASRIALGECPEEGFGRFRIDSLPIPHKPEQKQAPTAINQKPTRAEDLCFEARQWHGRFGEVLQKPSASQWGDFRGRIQAALNAGQINAVFLGIEQAAQKHGGKAWAGFVEARDYKEFRKRLSDLPLAETQRLLEDFVRWQRAPACCKQRQEIGG